MAPTTAPLAPLRDRDRFAAGNRWCGALLILAAAVTLVAGPASMSPALAQCWPSRRGRSRRVKPDARAGSDADPRRGDQLRLHQ